MRRQKEEAKAGAFAYAWRTINHQPQTGKPPPHSATPELKLDGVPDATFQNSGVAGVQELKNLHTWWNDAPGERWEARGVRNLAEPKVRSMRRPAGVLDLRAGRRSKACRANFAAEPIADLQPSFRDTGETPMLPSARRHAAPKARQGVFPS